MRNLQFLQLAIFIWTILLGWETIGCVYAFRKIGKEAGRANQLFGQQLLTTGIDALVMLILLLTFVPVMLWQAPMPARWLVISVLGMRGLGSMARMIGQLRLTSFLLGFTNGNAHNHPHRHMDKEGSE